MTRDYNILIVMFLIFLFSHGVFHFPEVLQGNFFLKNLSVQKADAAVVNRVLSGTVTSTTNGTVTGLLTPPVNPNSSFLIFQTRHNSNRPPGSMIGGRINSTGNGVEFIRVTDGVAPEPVPIMIQWYVVEFSGGVNVQRGEVTVTGDPTNVPISLVSGNVNQAFVTWSKTPNASDTNWNYDDPVVGEIINSTTLQFRVNTFAAGHVISWQVIEFTDPQDILVQRNVTSLMGGAISTNVNLSTSVDVNSSFVLVGYQAGSSAPYNDVGSRMLRAQLTGPNTVTIDRSIPGDSDDLPEIVIQTVWLKDGSAVQRGTRNFSPGSSQEAVPISPINTNHSIAFSSVQPVGGQNMGRSPYAGDDVIGVGSVTMALTSNQITMNRNNTADSTDIGWFVVTFKGLELVKRAFLSDGTPISDGNILPRGTLVQYLIYINNKGSARDDVSVRDVLDPAFSYEVGTMKVDNSVASCAAQSCTAIEESAIFTAANSVLASTDAVDGDIVSITGTTIDAGNQNVSNAQLDIAANRVWALLFTVKMK